MSVTPRGMSVQEAYREYRDGNFRVNRRYQRKLVWTLDEKRKLVDSLLHGFPIPLFLLAVSPRPAGGRTYDIIDGMQRLNAIFGFIENSFSFEGEYFDIEQLSRAKQVAQQGLFKTAPAAAPRLSAVRCANLLDLRDLLRRCPSSPRVDAERERGARRFKRTGLGAWRWGTSSSPWKRTRLIRHLSLEE